MNITDSCWEWRCQIVSLIGRTFPNSGINAKAEMGVWIDNGLTKKGAIFKHDGWFYFLNLEKGEYKFWIGDFDNRSKGISRIQLWQYKGSRGNMESAMLVDEKIDREPGGEELSRVWRVHIQ